MRGKIDMSVVTKIKKDSTFPLNQFAVQRYLKLYSFARNKNGGGVLIYV